MPLKFKKTSSKSDSFYLPILGTEHSSWAMGYYTPYDKFFQVYFLRLLKHHRHSKYGIKTPCVWDLCKNPTCQQGNFHYSYTEKHQAQRAFGAF